MTDRIVEVLGTDLGPAEPDGDAGVVCRDLGVAESVPQIRGLADQATHFIASAEAELSERQGGERADAGHPFASGSKGLLGPGARGWPVGVEQAGERQLAHGFSRLTTVG